MTTVEIVNRQRRRRVVAGPLRAFLERAASLVPPPGPCSVTVCLVSDRSMKRLNARWRGRAETTDVLSFASGDPAGPGEPLHLGDIVVSVERAARQAAACGRRFDRELRGLVLHGWLHLLGYDHKTDDGEMMRLERSIERRLLSRRSGRT